MSDLSSIEATEANRIVGSDATGTEQTPVQSTTAGALHVNLRNNAGTEVATAAAPLRIDPTGTTTQPVSASSLPLPTGAATETTLATRASETTLSALNAKFNSLGQKTSANSAPVVLASDQSAIPVSQSGTWSATVTQATGTNLHTVVDSSALPTGAATSALQTTGNASLAAIDAGIPAALGQTTMSASMPVTIASDQASFPIRNQDGAGNNLASSTTTPAGTEQALIVRNVPSGVQAVSQSGLFLVNQDILPATQTITALDVATSTVTGANGQVFFFGTPTVGSATNFSLSSVQTVTVQATFLGAGGTMFVETSMDGGTFWFRPNVLQTSTNSYTNGFAAGFMAVVNVAGMTNVRVRSAVSWSGTATVRVVESANSGIAWTVTNPSYISVLNSSTTVLAANATFTGTAELTNDYSMITVQVFTSHASAASGFKIQYSPDATNWDDADTYTLSAMSAGDGKFFTFPIQSVYFRIVYTNGATLQTTFRLSTVLHRTATKPSSHRIGDTLDDENDAELVKANMVGRTTAGNHLNIEATVNNELNVADFSDNGGTQGALTVGASAVLVNVSGTNLANRKHITLQNLSLVTLYWGYTNAVTTASGTALFPNTEMGRAVGPNTNVYVIAGTAGNNTRVTERA